MAVPTYIAWPLWMDRTGNVVVHTTRKPAIGNLAPTASRRLAARAEASFFLARHPSECPRTGCNRVATPEACLLRVRRCAAVTLRRSRAHSPEPRGYVKYAWMDSQIHLFPLMVVEPGRRVRVAHTRRLPPSPHKSAGTSGS